MLGYLYRMIVGQFTSCKHQWEIHNHGDIVDTQDRVTGEYYYLKCSKCGEMKSKNFRAHD
jgi:translation initiation factor 2 beta subunit (eIF-2beta)/eIF-5